MPLSLAWIDERVVLATKAGSVTARNITSQGGVRLGLGPTRDVVMIDAELEHVYSQTRQRRIAELITTIGGGHGA